MPTLIATTKPGKKYRSLKRPRTYEALRKQGMSKQSSARISNAQAHKSFTVDQLEAFVSSSAYDSDTAGLIALGIPEIPSLKGEQIAPGITRIRGNLCNVHGKYGPCDKAKSGGKKPAKGRKPVKPKKITQTPEQKRQARDAEHAKNQANVLQSLNIAPDGQQALAALRSGGQPDPAAIARGGFVQAGLVEQARDGSYRLSAAGRAALSAAASGDAGHAGSIISSARDRTTARDERTTAASDRKRQTQAKREQTAQLRAKRLAQRKPKKASKAFSFKVFKDASGKYRWVAISSSAFRDRDKEIVSTKALQDDCDYADKTGNYGPLRWWHMPGVDIGDCDFNAMHGRTLIESGTFRNQFIAVAAAKAAPELEISLGFLHLPTEPDAMSIFNHIRKFERSLVPIGKASNLLTQFSVKEQTPMIDTKVKEALDKLGSNPDALAYLQEVLNSATAREKALEDQKVAFKADEPAIELPDLVINGITYKAMPPMMSASAPDEETPAETMDEGGMEEPADEAGGLTLSSEDLTAISDAVGTAIQGAVAQIMGALDLEKKVGAHVQGLMDPYTAQKDASDAEKAEAITALQTSLKAAEGQQAALKAQLDELMGLQPEIVQRASESASTIVNPWLDQQLLGAVKAQVPADQQFEFGDLVTNLFGNINTPGQA